MTDAIAHRGPDGEGFYTHPAGVFLGHRRLSIIDVATGGQPMGFLCMVNQQRDRPQLPSAEELAKLKANPALAAFLGATSAS